MNNDFSVILVDSTSQAIQIEKVLTSRGLCCKLIPVPRHLSSDCGISIRILRQDLGRIQALLLEYQIKAQSIEEL